MGITNYVLQAPSTPPPPTRRPRLPSCLSSASCLRSPGRARPLSPRRLPRPRLQPDAPQAPARRRPRLGTPLRAQRGSTPSLPLAAGAGGGTPRRRERGAAQPRSPPGPFRSPFLGQDSLGLRPPPSMVPRKPLDAQPYFLLPTNSGNHFRFLLWWESRDVTTHRTPRPFKHIFF